MSAQDKIERILKQIHLLFADSRPIADGSDRIIVDKKEALALLEKLNLAVYEIMDQYEVTTQARELAQRRTEKKGEELIERVSNQAEDVYAASLIYTDDALNKVQDMMADAMNASQEIWNRLNMELEKETRRVREDQKELREQLQDFKDSNKYLTMIEDCNREREKKENDTKAPEKRIQNEAKHYAMNIKPEIRVNPTYFQRKGLETGDIPPMPKNLEAPAAREPEKSFEMPEIKVDLDAEYFKWQSEEAGDADKKSQPAAEKKERRFLFGKK